MFTEKESGELKELFVKHGIVLAYLFGSHAKGTARASSDVDIAVLLPYDTPRSNFFDVRLSLTNDLMDLLHKNEIDVVMLNEATPLLSHEIVVNGKLLYEDLLLRPKVDFLVRTSKRYADTVHFRKLSLQYLTARIERYRTQYTVAASKERHNG